MVFIFSDNVIYSINNTTNEMKKVYNLHTAKCYYEYFENNEELFVITTTMIMIFKSNIRPSYIAHPLNCVDKLTVADIMKYNSQYYILTNELLIQINELCEFKMYPLSNTIRVIPTFNVKHVKLFTYNDIIHYTYYARITSSNIHESFTIIAILCTFNLDSRETSQTILYEKKYLGCEPRGLITNICQFDNYILYVMNDDDTATSPTLPSPTSPTSLDSVSINMNNISMYNY